MIIGMLLCARTVFNTSKPFIFGIMESRTTTSYCPDKISCTPASPSGTLRTSKPSAVRYSVRSSVNKASSSTNNTRLMV